MYMDWQDQLQFILNKDVSSLTERDKVFLRSRQSYLTDEQRVYYDAILMNVPETSKPKKEDKFALFRELKKQAKDLGIEVPKGTKLDALQELLAK